MRNVHATLVGQWSSMHFLSLIFVALGNRELVKHDSSFLLFLLLIFLLGGGGVLLAIPLFKKSVFMRTAKFGVGGSL